MASAGTRMRGRVVNRNLCDSVTRTIDISAIAVGMLAFGLAQLVLSSRIAHHSPRTGGGGISKDGALRGSVPVQSGGQYRFTKPWATLWVLPAVGSYGGDERAGLS